MIHTIETRLKLNTTQELLVNSCVVLWSTYYRISRKTERLGVSLYLVNPTYSSIGDLANMAL